jgi:cyanophycin synthetase
MLLTDPAGRIALNADVPEIAALAEYAPSPIIYISTAEQNPLVGFHRAEGGMALFVRDGAVVVASGASEQPVLAATLPPDELPGALAGLALLWAMGLTWNQITVGSRQ